MRHDFAPLRVDAIAFLSDVTGIDFTAVDFDDPRWLCVTARDDEGALAGVMIFEFTTWFEAHLTAAVNDPRCVTRRMLSAAFSAVFSRAVRVTAYVEPHNAHALRQARRMGFRHEGYMRSIIEGNRDGIVLGMLRPDCRFLDKPQQPIFSLRREVIHENALSA